MNFRGRYRAPSVGFQIAPMVDIMLFLLCFFVTSQMYMRWEAEMDITLPTAQTARIEARLPGELILNVMNDGVVVVNGRHLNEGELGTLLQRLVKLFPGQPVVLRADRRTAYEHVIRVLDLCRRSDIWNVSFAAESAPDVVASQTR
jgi:biopolymer transport protein ExbD